MGKLCKESLINILKNRISQDYNTVSKTPHPSLFKDIKKSSERVKRAVLNREKIAIVGDYDVDGVVATTILSEFFEIINYPVEIVIPNRFKDGYGVSPNIVKRLDVNLIITVDNGISAIKASDECKNRGIDLIITDHHTPIYPLPNAYSIINPKQDDCPFPLSEICGAHIAWYFVASLKAEFELNINLSEFFEILAIAIIADVMPLDKINRTVVRAGLKRLEISDRAFVQVIREKLKKDKFSSDDIGFLISPRLNSAGRMEDAIYALKFLKSKSFDEAEYYFNILDGFNNKRKEVEAELTQKIRDDVDLNSNIIVSFGDEWHEGVIGICASRISEEFKKPAIIFSITETIAKGSARSYGEINIFELIKSQSDKLIGFGGHAKAAGLSIHKDKLEHFKSALKDITKSYNKELFQSKSTTIGEIDLNEVDLELLDILDNFEPFGEANPKPIFLANSIKVITAKKVGENERHLKLVLKNGANKFQQAIMFNTQSNISEGDIIDFSFSVSKNIYNGFISPILIINELF